MKGRGRSEFRLRGRRDGTPTAYCVAAKTRCMRPPVRQRNKPRLGPVDWGWAYHFLVVKDGRVYALFTGAEGWQSQNLNRRCSSSQRKERLTLDSNTDITYEDWTVHIVTRVCRSPATFMLRGTFHCCIAFVVGYDTAWGGGLLVGFREWLILSMKSGRNLTWDGLVLKSLLPEKRPWDELTEDEDIMARQGFARLLETFFAERSSPRGVNDIMYQYGKWLADEEGKEEQEATGEVEVQSELDDDEPRGVSGGQ